MKRLPLPITLAISLYYLNRSRQWLVKQHTEPGVPELTVTRSTFVWDKTADLDAISAACGDKWAFTACAGTFWFNRRGVEGDNIVVYEISEESFPLVKRKVNKKTRL